MRVRTLRSGLPHRLRVFISAKLGRCHRCMRWSLRGALLGWIALGIARLIFPAQSYLVLAWPVSFTALWLLHISVYALRSAVAAHGYADRPSNAPERATMAPAYGESVRWLSRRRALQTLVSGFFGAALVSLAYPRRASAECAPGWSGCGGNICCDTSHGFRWYCPQSNCANVPATDKCVNPDKLTPEQMKDLQACCPGLRSC